MEKTINIQTKTGPYPVTPEQLEWLETTGRLLDMSQHPQIGPVFPESGERLGELLQTMPEEPVGQVDPEDPEGSLADQPQADPPAEENEIVLLLKEQRDAQGAILENLKIIARFFDRPPVG